MSVQVNWSRAAALTLFCLHVSAQPPANNARPRPKIGVALAGGGALGLAHIGVLEWLEDHRIPVDYIAGTSMGGLIGGAYATGMRPAEISEFVSRIDWHEVLRGQAAFGDLAYRRKEDLRAFPNSLQFGLRHGLTIPGGLNAGQDITFLLDRMALPYSLLKSFDDLPIPFRCVGTDLTTGQPHVFKEGALGQALRSTMSLPAIFTPVKNGATIYADGGLVDNLPVDIVKAMGADIVIAVALSPTAFDPDTSQSMFSIMNRSISVMISANELRSMQMADVLISVDLSGYVSTDYKGAAKIIPRGYQAAEQKAKLLSRLALDEPAWREYIAQREAKRIHTVPEPEFVDVNGVPPPVAHDIEKDLAPLAGKPLDIDRLEHDINIISGTGRFSSFSYVMGEKDDKSGLVVEGNEKEYGPPFLDLGLVVAPRAYMSNVPLDIYDRTTPVANYRVRQFGGGLDLGYAFDRSSELRFGYDIAELRTSLWIGAPTLPTPAGRLGSSSIRYNLDRLDSPLVARRGEIVSARVQWNDAVPGAPHGFPLSELYFGIVRPVSKPASVFLQGYGGTTFGYDNTGLPQFFLGGVGRFNAYGTNELRTDQYFLFRLGYEHELFQLPPLLGNKAYATAAYEVGKAYFVSNEPVLPTDVAVGLVFETFVGPLGVGGSVGNTGHQKWYFSVGRIF